jgi:hypothetical protein
LNRNQSSNFCFGAFLRANRYPLDRGRLKRKRNDNPKEAAIKPPLSSQLGPRNDASTDVAWTDGPGTANFAARCVINIIGGDRTNPWLRKGGRQRR